MKGQLPAAADAAKKALSSEPNLPAAHLCMATIYETQRLPPDSLIAAATRATLGDSLNPTAWETIARANLTKGDTLKAVEAFRYELRGDPMNTALRLGIAELLWRQQTTRSPLRCSTKGWPGNRVTRSCSTSRRGSASRDSSGAARWTATCSGRSGHRAAPRLERS